MHAASPSAAHRSVGQPVALAIVALAGVAACGSGPENPLALDERLCPVVGSGVTQGGQGSFTDDAAPVQRRIVLMGGGPEDDGASRGFVEAAGGGDVLIMRARGSTTSYPNYFMQELGSDPRPNAAVTVRLDVAAGGANPGVLCRVQHAEAIWIAGGNQWDYLGLWPTTLHEQLSASANRQIAIGGTSAGAMSLGEGAFDAREGSVTSTEALADPLRTDVSVSLSPFGQPELEGVLVDTHFSERDREGRLLAFLARFSLLVESAPIRGIGLDEGTAITVHDGTFTVSGPTSTAAAWIYQYAGTPSLASGTPLSLDAVQRVRLAPGDTGAWPVDLSMWPVDSLAVIEGNIVRAP